MIKIAVISDIHGNMQALEAVLDDIKKENCEKIFCLGDLALAGPEPRKTVEFIQQLCEKGDIKLIIQGNTDEIIGNYSPEIAEKLGAAFPIMLEALKDDIKILPAELKEFLKNLPKQADIDMEGVRILLVHGSPRKNDENILPDLPIEKVEEMIVGTNADLIFCGHTHIPCGYQTKTKQTVVNSGSVGRPFTQKPQSCYIVAELSNGSFNIEHRFVNYDNRKASNILAKRDFAGASKLAQILIEPKTRHM